MLGVGLRLAGTVLLAIVAASAVDRLTARRGLLPPAFRQAGTAAGGAAVRRAAALAVLTAVFWIGVFAPLGAIGLETETDLEGLTTPRLFLLHGLFVAALAAWYLLGFVGHRPAPPSPAAGDPLAASADPASATGPAAARGSGFGWAAQLGLRAENVWKELGLGLVAGLAAWLLVLAVLLGLGLAIFTVAGEEALPQAPPVVIPWIAALPIGIRLAISLSAGVVEEVFFRGFLQPRVGIAFSTFLFVLAHAGYEQPLMLVGITLLSLAYSFLVRWRQSVWAAMAAHTLFDAVQLTVVIPAALDLLPAEAGSLARLALLAGG